MYLINTKSVRWEKQPQGNHDKLFYLAYTCHMSYTTRKEEELLPIQEV